MCNLVHGEALAFGHKSILSKLKQLEDIPKIPGNATIIPLLPEQNVNQDGMLDSIYNQYGFLHVTGIPDGNEVEAVSLLSAFFSEHVMMGEVLVDLNYYLPNSMPNFREISNYRLSRIAENWASEIRRHCDVQPNQVKPIAIIDSGVDESLIGGRPIYHLDFSQGRTGATTDTPHDQLGHGTRVALILDHSLLKNVPLVSAKIADRDQDVTVLNLSQAFASTVALHAPAVVNISLAPLDDTYTCPNPKCKRKVKVPAFHARILRRIFALADRTFIVMAAGNQGQICNDRHSDEFTQNLIFAVAVGSNYRVTNYSSYPTIPESIPMDAPMAALAFGGDGPENEDGTGIFATDRDSYGTSFAAPFVSASIYPMVIQRIEEGSRLDRGNVLHQRHTPFGDGWRPYYI